MRSLIQLWFLLMPGFALRYILRFCLILATLDLSGQQIQFDHQEVPWRVQSILQDRQGFIWFGSQAAIYRYDGYEFKEYSINPYDTTALQTGNIVQILEDYLGDLWCLSLRNGIYRFDPRTEVFHHYSNDPYDSTSLASKDLAFVYEDGHHRLWISASGHGLNIYNRDQDQFQKFKLATDSSESKVNKLGDGPIYNINDIFEYKPQEFWLSTFRGPRFKFDINDRTLTKLPKDYPEHFFKDSKGQIWGRAPHLVKYHEESRKFEPIQYSYISPQSAPFNSIPIGRRILEFDSGRLLVSLSDSDLGVGLIDTHYNTVQLFRPNASDPNAPKDGFFGNMMIDNTGMLWASTGYTIETHNPHKSILYHNSYLSAESKSTEYYVFDIHVDDSSNIWVGTFNHGLIKYNQHNHISKQYFYDPDKPGAFYPNFGIRSIYQDKYGIFWIGSFSSGLYKLDPISGKWKNYQQEFENHGLNWRLISAIYEDTKGYLWIGTTDNALSKLKLNNGTGFEREFISYEMYRGQFADDRSVGGANITQIYEDPYSNIWIASRSALSRYEPLTNDFDKWVLTGSIFSVSTDQSNVLWVGTESGLFKAKLKNDPDSIAFERTEIADELVGNPLGIVGEDKKGNFWLGTIKGRVVKYHPATGDYRIFDHYDGAIAGELNCGSQGKSGLLAFGGAKGLITLHPDSIMENLFEPPVVVVDFQVDNISVTNKDSLNGRTLLSEVINFTDEIVLPFGQNFSFKFAAMDYSNPDKNLYQHKLEGFDEDWSPPSTTRTATYTNLWEGDYTFRVKGSNNDGVWNEEGTSIQIIILPPWYRSKIAWIIYGGLLVFALVWARKIVIQREREKTRHQMDQMELQQAKEMDTMKTQFFANISHEFRTPLTLILGPLKQMKEGTFKGDAGTVINVMIRNSKRLLHLINQLLDFSKLEAGAVGLQASIGDLVEFVRTMFASFETTAQTRDINYVFQSNVSSVPAYYDRDKLEKVIINLLSNAFKFTTEGGSIKLTMTNRVQDTEVDKGEGIIEIRIEDSGKGIEQQKLPHIFDRFYQADASSTRQQEGTGIGLALAKELVELHYGTISATSHKGLGTAFTIHLPLGRAHLKDEEIVVRKGYQPIDTTALETLPEDVTVPLNSGPENGDRPLLLIIDDNEDMRLYLREVLAGVYRIEEAQNGVIGWDQAVEHIPDLVISDVMMPEMDGQELCQKLKTDERTSHIPVVLLTARAGEEAKVEGLETGADDYVTKPFSPVELKARVHNLIELRQKLREQFSKNLSLEPKDIAVTSADERFLKRAMDILEIHRSDAEFNAVSFTKEIGLSRSQLHRKLKALTDQSTGEFIRSYRLKYARQLIEKEYGNMAQVAYECGFNNPSYFAECFKKQFGVLPSEFAKEKN